jgi:hypothetical protein
MAKASVHDWCGFVDPGKCSHCGWDLPECDRTSSSDWQANPGDASAPVRIPLHEGENYVPIEELEQQIANLSSQLAYLTSYEVMQQRVKDLGLVKLSADNIKYIEVPGYVERQTTSLAPPPVPVVVNASAIDPQFKESLFEWVTDQVQKTAQLLSEAMP